MVCVPALSQSPPKSLIVVLLPETSLSDWLQADAPNLHRIVMTGALAVMNTRTARLPNDHIRETPESAVLTLGAGSRAAGNTDLTDFCLTNTIDSDTLVKNGDLYTRRMGRAAPPGRWVNVQWPRILRENRNLGYDLQAGNLGNALQSHGIPVASAGGRFAFPVACTSDGTVRISPAPFFPAQGCLIWDAGADIKKADALIGKAIAQTVSSKGRLIILSPSVDDRDYAQQKRLSPVAMWGSGILPGMIFSPSTHCAGLVINTDFAWTVTTYFGATETDSWLPTQPFGRPWTLVPSPNAPAAVEQIENKAYAQAEALRVLPAVAIFLGIFVLVSAVLTITGRPYPWTMLLPIFVIDALAFSGSVRAMAVWIVGLTLSAIFLRPQFKPKAILAIGTLSLTATLTTDMLVGDPLMRFNLLGYSAVEGARYYGMGNEAMGALLGAALVTARWLWSRGENSRRAAWISLGLIALLLGSPLAGAKAGGLLVAVASFGVFVWTVTKRKWTQKTAFCLSAVMLTALAIASLGDFWHHGNQQTHIGQAAGRIYAGGWREACDIVTRKLAVEARLLYHSAWACPLWISISGLFFWNRKTQAKLNLSSRALWNSGMTAIVTCLLVNDAGVVAAALCGVIVWCGLTVGDMKKSLHPVEVHGLLPDEGSV